MVSSPQGTVSDKEGTIWIANCGNSTVSRYPGGDHLAAQWASGDATGLDRPVWLCSDAASFVTGHALAVDGGYVAQ